MLRFTASKRGTSSAATVPLDTNRRAIALLVRCNAASARMNNGIAMRHRTWMP